MRALIILVSGIGLFTAGFAQANPPTWEESRCGANWSWKSDSYASDDGKWEDFNIHNSSIRSVTIRSTKRKTRIKGVEAWDQNSYRWVDLTHRLASRAYCEGTYGKLCNNQEVTVCIGSRRDFTQIRVFTTGSDSGKWRLKLGFAR